VGSLWRRLFPKYKCKHCRDSGVLQDRHSIGICHYCRDIEAEIREASGLFCTHGPGMTATQQSDGRVVCDVCGKVWGFTPV
jgi:hypothetical protein